MSKEIQSKSQAVRVNVEHDSPSGYACITASEKQPNGRYKVVESLCIPNDTINAVIAALQVGGDMLEIKSLDVRVGDALVEWRLDSSDSWSSIGMNGDTRVRTLEQHTNWLFARVESGDIIKLTGYEWRVRRAS